MKERLIINKQKMKFYNKKVLNKTLSMGYSGNFDITEEDNLVDAIKEQLESRKVNFNEIVFFQELSNCIEIEQLPETYDELKELLKENNKVEFDDTSVKDRKYIWVLTPLGEILLGFAIDNGNNVEVIDTDKTITIAECYQAIRSLVK